MRDRFSILFSLLSCSLAITACGSVDAPGRRGLATQEDFASTTSHSRSYVTTQAQTCEAARRALLSQGYVISAASAELINGRKHFQPESEVHVEVEFRIVCAPDGTTGAKTIAFVSALQDRYALKKVNNSASLGVGVLGSVSLPFSSSDDALVKVASETLNSGSFYDRFFRLLERYLPPEGSPEPVFASSPTPAASTPPAATMPATAPPAALAPTAPPTSLTPPNPAPATAVAPPTPASAPANVPASAPAAAASAAPPNPG